MSRYVWSDWRPTTQHHDVHIPLGRSAAPDGTPIRSAEPPPVIPETPACECVLLKGTVSTISKPYHWITGGSVAQSKCQNSLFSRYLRRLECSSSNQVVGGSNPSGRTILQKSISAARATGPETSSSNRRQTKRRFDYPAPRRVGRRRFSGGGPERSGGRGAVGPEAIRPGALIFVFLINDLAFRLHRGSTENRAPGK